MADTTNFAWTKPVVGGDNNSWGGKLNAALDEIDEDLQAVKDIAEDAAEAADATAKRVKIAPNANQNIPASADTAVVWAGPNTVYNEGAMTVSTSGITVPSGFTGLLVLTAQVGLGGVGDPSNDENTAVKVWIESSGVTVGEAWVQRDAQNDADDGMRIQVRAEVSSPVIGALYVVKVRTPSGSGTVALQSASSWFAAHQVR